MGRLTQAERTEATTGQLLAAAQELFGRDGYTATSIDAVAAAAGMTKGAAYHHFAGKPALFRAVFAAEQQRMAAELERAVAAEPDPWSALRRGCHTWLRRCLDPAFRQIVLLDGPGVLGWAQVREIQSGHTLRVLTDGLRAAAAGDPDADLSARAHLAFGALCEAGLLLAKADDPEAALPGVLAEAERLLAAVSRP
ncbi:MAG TPA: TetR/AcrR family transcriptional regulator [Pseudonocardia sp.]|nr:TetR/AcrR family transcriptional regulator [Pseudonocardia sp.]